MFRSLSASLVAVVASLALSGQAEAGPITCPTTGTPNRQMTLGDAISCYSGDSVNPNAGTVAGHLGGSWISEGTVVGSNGTDDLFTVFVTTGGWGSIPASGTWAIDSSFWSTYGRAAISAHVGQGGGNPDYWVFEILPNSLSGTWSLAKLSGTGGGLSNMQLWGSGTATPCTENCGPSVVPEPASMLLMGSGLVALAGRLRRRRAKHPVA